MASSDMLTGKELLCGETLPEGKSISLAESGISISRNDIASGVHVFIPHDVYNQTHVVSQIGLKDIWMGIDPGSHNRWHHSRGAYTVAQIWLKLLYEGKRIPPHMRAEPYPDYQTARVLVGDSLLLHDYGHLFFSHLLEEALAGINWVPSSPGIRSLEYTVLKDRLSPSGNLAQAIQGRLGNGRFTPEEELKAITNLIYGWSGMPWLQAVVNGPIDADKIDYLRRDESFLRKASYPVRTRLHFGPTDDVPSKLPWLDQFLSEQYVNHAGFLCLPGRSGLAAADLWRERIFLYDRFYLAPAIRAAERIALEIIQGFLIRWVMSRPFSDRVSKQEKIEGKLGSVKPADLMEKISSLAAPNLSIEVVSTKYQIVVQLLTRLASVPEFNATDRLDWECFSFMRDTFLSDEKLATLDPRYKKALSIACDKLNQLGPDSKSLRLEEFAKHSIVGSPLQFPRQDVATIRKLVRPLQHQYGNDVLIDVVAVPMVIAAAAAPGANIEALGATKRFSGLLVPKGKVENWQPSSRELCPLNEQQVQALERPFGRLIVVALDDSRKSRNSYVFDRVVAELYHSGIHLNEVSSWPIS